MLLLFTLVFWITIIGANYPSQILATLLLDTIYPWLKGLSTAIGLPWWLDGLLLDGIAQLPHGDEVYVMLVSDPVRRDFAAG